MNRVWPDPFVLNHRQRQGAVKGEVWVEFLCLIFASVGESEFSDARFVEVAETFCNHAVVLLLGGLGEREVEALLMGEGEGDAAVLRRVGAGEEARVVAVLHVLAIGFKDAGVGTGLRKNFAQHGEIKPKGGSES